MHTNTEGVAYEIKISVDASGKRSIDSTDGNGNGLSVLQSRDMLQWALTQIQDQVIIALSTAAVVDAKRQERGIITPKII
jgi:hypothetical protein